MKIDAMTSSTREVFVDVDAASLRDAAQGHDVLILRVTGLQGPATGRPVTRSVRIPVALLEPTKDYDYEYRSNAI